MNLTRDLIFLVIYILGMSGILYWRKRQSDPASILLLWDVDFMMMVTYFVVLEVFIIHFIFDSIAIFQYFCIFLFLRKNVG